jgi:NAD(P)-dependent dehydrogenase (short-subunit alcohol dehydrogenase family)
MSTPLVTSFNAESTAEDVIAGVDLEGKRAIVTGGSSGIGVETVRALASANAEVILAVRDLSAGEQTAAQLSKDTGNSRITARHLDLVDQASVSKFVSEWDGPLHILVNNAGIMAAPLERTPEGWESQFATNHLGHFALAVGLHDALAAANGARVVVLSSPAHLGAPVMFEDINYENRDYERWSAYGQSKSANVLFAVGAAQRWANDGITVNSLAPGAIQTKLQRYITEEDMARMKAANPGVVVVWKTPEQGAATSVLVAASPLVEGISGRYFEDVNEAGENQPGTRSGYAAHAVDPASADRLWDISLDLVGKR